MRYLLNATINFPLSVDTSVWPGVKNDLQMNKIFYNYDVVPNGLNLFNLREDCDRFIITHNQNEPVIIAIGFYPNNAQHLIKQHRITPPPTNDKKQKEALYFLGYDVCDYWLISGLMNCGLDQSRHKELKNIFCRSLNQYGLFYDFNIALRFASEISNIVSEHAPFIPSGLFIFDVPDDEACLAS
jgi:hypothetical protein